MIITRTPLRVSLGGGGTDLPSYYRRAASGGFLIAAAITKYVYIAVHKNFVDEILLKYSRIEKAAGPGEIEHPLLREALIATDVTSAVEISSMADIPAGTGLGSSGAFTVGALRALHAFQRRFISQVDVAEMACRIEIDVLGEPVGKQDQYIAAIGGVTAFEFRPDDSVEVVRVPMSAETRDRLEEELLLFYTGIRRSASHALSSQEERSQADDADMRKNLDGVRALGLESYGLLGKGDLDSFGPLLTEQWRLKLERSPTELHRTVDLWIRRAVEAGAAGGKLVGAGDGGFLLIQAHARSDVRQALSSLGLEEVRFGFDHEGTVTLVS
jgi:D-glycero-alpha-D-manno-heptose-7-phosphate kinase